MACIRRALGTQFCSMQTDEPVSKKANDGAQLHSQITTIEKSITGFSNSVFAILCEGPNMGLTTISSPPSTV